MFASLMQAQITIGGNVYGGGNAGDTKGSTKVTVYAGDLNNVFGGARMANVGGGAFVNIDGEHASDNIFINSVYGGNDIAGTVGTDPNNNDPVPSELTEVGTTTGKNAIDQTWNAFIRTSPTPVPTEGVRKSLVIGSMFGGGNGDYDYTSDDSPYKGMVKPEISKIYLEILGGCIAHLYGGGNNATVNDNTTICINNDSPVLTETNVWPADPTSADGLKQLVALAQRTGLSTFQSDLTSYAFNFARVFGGNNKADMAIRPTWNLQKGVIRDLYSGGNQGAMTSNKGILLPVSPKPENSDKLTIENVFGGCRMADVNPAKSPIAAETINGTYFPAGYAARVLIEGGDIQNVYGGNDISGTIYGGNAVGIHSSIKGDVYGGGNGSYAYTDNPALKGDPNYGDFYYPVPEGMSSVEALRAFRPNAESVSIRLIGTEAKPTIIGGAVYCGGNSATLHNDTEGVDAAAELKIGSYVLADKVFLGNNGANMAAESMLKQYGATVNTDQPFSSMNLASKTKDENGRTQFDKYMDGVVMDIMPRVVFDDVGTYKPYSTYFGSFYCGGNVGSMKIDGAINLSFKDKVVIFNKVVGGSNEANVYQTDYNPQYLGGILGAPDANGNKLILNFEGLKIQPMRWVDPNDKTKGLEWNTVKYDPATESFKPVAPVLSGDEGAKASEEDLARRLYGGNIYGGCYSNGHVEGNVIINLNASIHERDRLFDETDEGDILYENIEEGKYNISKRHTGVILSEQGMDVLGAALNVFGGGYGGDSEIWGSSTINLNKGYTFQIFGGGEMGAIGNAISHEPDPNDPTKHNLTYAYDQKYSTYINLNGPANLPGVARGAEGDSEDMAECEFIYGGAFEGPIAGDTHINLNNGRIFKSFAGSCNADVLGHTETYVGPNGFPWIRDHIYGGNDLGGSILGKADFTSRIRSEVAGMVDNTYKEQAQKTAAYMEYTQGRVDRIFGGCFGNYDYEDAAYKTRVTNKPYLHNTFVNFRPNTNANNAVTKVFGAGEGCDGDRDGDKAQDHSYVLIDIPDGVDNFANTEVFGAGAYDGLGMRYTPEETFAADFELNEASAVIDLLRGRISAAYGGSYEEGITRRTLVNVPQGSTIKLNNIFGGAYGLNILPPCDVYESNVDYRSGKAFVNGAIYGGNNNERRTLYAHVNVSAPVYKENGYSGTVYGAGRGVDTWSEYTEVNLEDGANVWEVYGGGEMGHVLNAESVMKYMQLYKNSPSPDILAKDPNWGERWNNDWAAAWKNAWTFGDYYVSQGEYTRYIGNKYMNLANSALVRTAEMDDRDHSGLTAEQKERIDHKYNTNVIIHKGATVGSYAYGGGLGADDTPLSGDVYGNTYIALLGGTVAKDIYAAGTTGAVYNLFGAENFTASTNAFIAGGTVRNVYGGGWKGDVGYHDETTNETTGDVLGETHVVIGIRPDQTNKPADYGFYNGVPAIQRNAYGGGEGGAIYGTSNLTLNNGYIGYVHLNADQMQNEQGSIVAATQATEERYEEKINDETYWVNNVWSGANRLKDSGNLFGGGYDVLSSVDNSNVTMWGGVVRNSLVGGGEIATIGRGAIEASGPSNSIRTLKGIYKPGKTNVTMYNGHVQRNVFGGGKGYNIFGYGQQGTLYMDGYVFGQTEVQIHGGEIGTDEGLAEGYGNVFGGGDIGYVYSPSIYSDKTKAKTPTGSPGHIYYYNDAGDLTEDCKVVIAPYLQVKDPAGITVNGHTHNQYDYVETDDLNTLPKKNDAGVYAGGWEKLFTGDTNGESERGIHIHNAVFAGGNVSSNSDQTYANATTIFGNTTATLYDVYHRDFITVGTEHTGGLYGGGNLSVVDGYRELNITNYGTDYYGLKQTISIQEYRGLSNRERAYFQLEYKCTASPFVIIGGVEYKEGQRLTEDEYLKLLSNEAIAQQIRDNFEPYGFCSIYAGRLLNTIQRADLCGVFGSRMVLQGAKDRVAEVGEDIDYTINRVGELSLNQQHSVRSEDTGDNASHGNYFGIYSLVNYLGNLTSDVRFGSSYVDGGGVTQTDKTYYSYKSANPTSSDRNKGQSYNQVALASGVFLELTTENSTKDKKDYGYVTGVVELDLINVKKDLVGGGFVYAKNEHRVPKYYPHKKNVLLSEYNKPTTEGGKQPDEARSYRCYYYTDENLPTGDEAKDAVVISGDDSHVFQTMEWQTSGNFIHPSKRIVDDCYPTNNAYIIGSANYSEAHYWYVKGEVYIYDQKVSAYTGSATAYSKEVHLPLTITAASNGKLQLLNVKPNLYAYKTDKDGTPVKIGTIGNDGKPIDKVWVNNESDSYGLNDIISWWDWHQLSPADRQYFVTETYVNCVTCTIDGVEYEQGTYVMDQKDYDKFMADKHDIRDSKGEHFKDDDNHDIGKTFVFRSSNNISHETGYILTFDMNTPKVWDNYYSPTTGSSVDGKIMKTAYEAKFTDGMTAAQKQAVIDAWREGPTFTPTETGVYGKQSYKAGEVITEATYLHAGEGKEKMEKAYVATESVTYTYNGITKTVNPGTAISETEYNGIGTNKSHFAPAFYCTNSVKLTNENYMLYGELKTQAEIDAMKAISGKLATDSEIDDALTPAYICTQNGEYGGQRFETGTNYSAIQAWSSLPEADRTKFNYNFDALDLLTNTDYLTVDPNVTTSPDPSVTAAAFHAPYTNQVDVEYQAVFRKKDVDVKFNGRSLADGETLTNEQFETIRNDRRHYTHVETNNNGNDVYIVKNNFVYLGTPYGRGQVVDADVYNANAHDVETVRIPNAGDWYYCYEDYQAENGSTVNKGTIITKAEYGNVPNYQQYFVIQGQEPTETTTLYVSRESNAYDVMKEKIITVVYQYTYYEDEDDGSVKLTNELHVINVRLDLESGVPQIGQLSPPATVLPGNAVGLRAPDVNPGLYEVLTSGWELYATQDDADNHRNGVPFENNNTPVYWYQNGKNYISFYSKTYLGKTYSNPVPLSVANYHDLDAVMKDKEHHMYVDNTNVDRAPKIYLDNRACESDPDKSELDLLKDFFDLSLQSQKANSGETKDHEPLNNHVHAGRNLEFFLNSDLSPKKYTTWTPIGNNSTTGDAGQCFEGILHGDGHTLSGLSNSLFGHLCGEVYNLGVTGSFTGAGIAETGDGYIENSWVKSSAAAVNNTVNAVFGNPTRTESDNRGLVQVENCYYPESNKYAAPSSNTHGVARKMSDNAFYNGEVAYNLNGFYLHKRYYQGSNLKTGTAYQYLQPNADGTLPDNTTTGYYPDDYAIYQPDVKVAAGESLPYLGYVENRFYDGDYRYAGGTTPEGADIHMKTVTSGEGDDAVTTNYYVPVWPDDYIFFGQSLSYDHVDGTAHQELPSAIKKSSGRILTDASGNRVYRAPAYYGSKDMQMAHFNPYAVFAQSKKDDANMLAHKGLTAIDFTGYNDLSKGYKQGLQQGKYFYPPLLDEEGLTGFRNVDLTQNLLVYSPQETTNKATHDVLNNYFSDLVCEELGDDSGTDPDEAYYRRIATVTPVEQQLVKGHVVFQDGATYVADRDHFLVDRQEFNAPIAYQFDGGHRMWYQRTPDNYVTMQAGSKRGWESVSIPFTAELVTTPQKGEITHFYGNSNKGHEYWLREFKGGKNSTSDATVFVADFQKPAVGDETKSYTNTFLWDYYYQYANRKDVNTDDYQNYYSNSHSYVGYPYSQAGKPYIVGFPGDYYYEFDLSGSFVPEYTAGWSGDRILDAQTITFASEMGAQIAVSDDELKGVKVGNYTFRPNYAARDLTTASYVLNANGDSYDKVETTTTIPFRPYFISSADVRTRSIVFGDDNAQFGGDEKSRAAQDLIITTREHKIIVESQLRHVTDVRIVNTAGITMKTFTIKPGEVVETYMINAGVYIVQTTDARHTKKLAVK